MYHIIYVTHINQHEFVFALITKIAGVFLVTEVGKGIQLTKFDHKTDLLIVLK